MWQWAEENVWGIMNACAPDYFFGFENNVDNFNQHIKDRYAELRNSYFSLSNLTARYENYYNLLKLSGAAEREENKWSGDSDVYGHEINFDNEIVYITNWINSRINYLDSQFDYDETMSIHHIEEDKRNSFIYNLLGQPINRQNTSKSIYIKNGKKYVK